MRSSNMCRKGSYRARAIMLTTVRDIFKVTGIVVALISPEGWNVQCQPMFASDEAARGDLPTRPEGVHVGPRQKHFLDRLQPKEAEDLAFPN